MWHFFKKNSYLRRLARKRGCAPINLKESEVYIYNPLISLNQNNINCDAAMLQNSLLFQAQAMKTTYVYYHPRPGESAEIDRRVNRLAWGCCICFGIAMTGLFLASGVVFSLKPANPASAAACFVMSAASCPAVCCVWSKVFNCPRPSCPSPGYVSV